MFDIVRNIMEDAIERVMAWVVPLDTFDFDWDETEEI